MNLNDRFAVAEDDISGTYDCMTCGALVPFNRLEDHNHWHEELDKATPNPYDWGGGMTFSEQASLRDKPTECITVKGEKFRHQTVYDGVGSRIHCVFCQKSWASCEEYQQDITEGCWLGEGI